MPILVLFLNFFFVISIITSNTAANVVDDVVEICFDDARHLLRSDVVAGLDDQLFEMRLTCGRLASHNLYQVSLEVGKYPFSTVELARPGRNAQHREIRLDELDGLLR